MSVSVAVDIVYDCPIDAFALPMQEYDVTMRVLEANGPAGGNPFVEFTADTHEQMKNFLIDTNLFEEVAINQNNP
jgi:hypothetical protein